MFNKTKTNPKQRLLQQDGGEVLYNGSYNDPRSRRMKGMSLFSHPKAPLFICIFGFIIDTLCFYSLFQMISPDNPLVMLGSVLGFLCAFDLIPIAAAENLKKKVCGIPVSPMLIWLPMLILLVAMISNIALRLLTMELYVSSAVSASSPLVIGPAMFGCIVPMFTSVLSFLVTFSSSDPFKEEKLDLEDKISQEREEIRRLEGHLKEYQGRSHQDLFQLDTMKYHNKLMEMNSIAAWRAARIKDEIMRQYPDEETIQLLESCTTQFITARFHEELAAIGGLQETLLSQTPDLEIKINETMLPVKEEAREEIPYSDGFDRYFNTDANDTRLPLSRVNRPL